MDSPLVTVVCLCYNHARFVEESILSVMDQSCRNIQLIVIDDASTDNSVEVIARVIKDRPDVTFLPLTENLGNCQAFNKGLALARGEFIIDLAADDVLLNERIQSGVNSLNSMGPQYGVQFSDAELIDEVGHRLGFHSDRFSHDTIPQGDIYRELIRRYFICSPSMMIRTSVLKGMGGYDESLAYEDFDFWIRSAREYKYVYAPTALVKRRLVRKSMARSQYRFTSRQLESTFRVCVKISRLNRNEEEKDALSARIRYELLRAIRVGRIELAWKYFKLLFNS